MFMCFLMFIFSFGLRFSVVFQFLVHADFVFVFSFSSRFPFSFCFSLFFSFFFQLDFDFRFFTYILMVSNMLVDFVFVCFHFYVHAVKQVHF
jgi:hypothetical protein